MVEERRQPRQKRSQERVQMLLDTAATLFAEQGYDTVTTNAIAARAGVSIGSLYQFFPNKEAVAGALAERYLARMRALLGEYISPELVERYPIPQMIERLVGGLVQFEAQNPAFETMFLAQTGQAGNDSLHAEILQQIVRTIGAYFPALAAHEVQHASVVMLGMVKGVLKTQAPPDQLPAEQVIRELTLALLAYLRAVLLRAAHPLPPELV